MDTKLFIKENFEVEALEENNKVYFGATRIAKALGYTNPQKAIRDHCKLDGVTIRSVGVVTGKKADGKDIIQTVEKKFIDEGNLYRLIIKSQLPEAERLERWIFEEVLPSIRKYGIYATENTVDKIINDPDFGIKILTKVKEEQDKRKQLEAIIEINKPYANFAREIEASRGNLTVGEFAKLISNSGLDIGRNRLFEWLRERGYLIRKGSERNIPKQQYIEQGLFEIKEFLIHTNSDQIIKTSISITGKGQIYFFDKLREVQDV